MTRGFIRRDEAEDWDSFQDSTGFFHADTVTGKANRLTRGLDPEAITDGLVGFWMLDEPEGSTEVVNYGDASRQGSGNLIGDGSTSVSNQTNTLGNSSLFGRDYAHFDEFDEYINVNFGYDAGINGDGTLSASVSCVCFFKLPDGDLSYDPQSSTNGDIPLTFDQSAYFRFAAVGDSSPDVGTEATKEYATAYWGCDGPSSGGQRVATDTKVNDGKWHMLGATYDYPNGHIKIYLDGEKENQILNAFNDNEGLGEEFGEERRFAVIGANSEKTEFEDVPGNRTEAKNIRLQSVGFWEGNLLSEEDMANIYTAFTNPTFVTSKKKL